MEYCQSALNRLLLFYMLLMETSELNEQGERVPVIGLVDFDNVNSLYSNGFEVLATDMSDKGVALGLLIKYEDELYSVDEYKWFELYEELRKSL